MRKTVLISTIVLSMLAGNVVAEESPSRRGGSRKRVLIGLKNQTGRQTDESRRSFVRGHGGRVHRSYRSLSAVAAELSDSQISALRADPSVAYVEEDGVLYALDAELDASWGVNRIGAGQIHASGNKGAGIKVAVIDTGIDLDHPDLSVAGNVTFVDGTTTGDDDNGHGTHCAGIIAALDNGTGTVGVAPEASIYAVKVLDSTGSGYLSDVVAGIDWAIENGMQVISLSMGTNSDYQTMRDACARADARGIIVVAAAGNDYRNRRGREQDTVDYPARYDSVIAVGAIDQTDTRAYFSSTGSTLELAAPGVYIYSTYIGGDYAVMSGTSMACPHVAGAAALVLSGPGGDVRTVLRETAGDLGDAGWDKWYGYGLVNAATAAYEPMDVHDIVVTRITAPSTVVQGDVATIEVTVENTGDFDETFDVTLTDDTDQLILDSKMSNTLLAGASTTITFSWNTAGSTVDMVHTLIASAGPVVDETNTADNSISSQVMIEPVLTDIAITALEVPDPVVKGELTNISVTVENTGNQNVAGPIVVSVVDTPSNGGTPGEPGAAQTINGLPPGASTTLTFIWNTASASLGEHLLTANHDIVDDESGNDSGGRVVMVEEKPVGPEEFTFTGTVAPRAESGHVVTVSTAGIMYVNLTWNDRSDLRLRIYDPSGMMVAEADSSTWRNRVEEITIDVGPGDWTVTAVSDTRRRFINYTVDVIINH